MSGHEAQHHDAWQTYIALCLTNIVHYCTHTSGISTCAGHTPLADRRRLMTENDALEALREATATIRGYIYQFDASILAVLAATSGQEVTVEGVEDFDVLSNETDTYGQVKYYEAQKLTDSTLRDAIVPMIEGFLRYPAVDRNRKRYILYGHFKQAPEDVPAILLEGHHKKIQEWQQEEKIAMTKKWRPDLIKK